MPGAEPGDTVFLNLSNHPSAGWSDEQRAAALELAPRIEDLPFPNVPPEADEKEVGRLTEQVLGRVPAGTSHAMVMGEFTLTYALVRGLLARGIVCVVATTQREKVETTTGTGEKTTVSRFRFERFRRYPSLSEEPPG